MKAVIQRVSRASVTVDGTVRGSIGRGYVVLLGVAKGDTEKDVDVLASKTATLRLFEDPPGRMNLALADVGGDVLVVPQFTLLARCSKGTRPSFDGAEAPALASAHCDRFVAALRERGLKVETGVFGADMKVELLNDGPVTILLDS